MRRFIALPLVVACALALATSCAHPPAPERPTISDACDPSTEPRCAHVIDRLLIPRLRALHIPAREAPPAELCRRMSIDLIGRIPKPEELEACRAKPPRAMAETLMNSPEYARAQQRGWGELIGYDLNDQNWYGDVVDIDRLIGSAYSIGNTLSYSELATRIAVHPAFYALHQDDDWTANIFSVFLGRTARPDELAGMRPLLGIWQRRAFCDGVLWFQAYRDAGGDKAEANDFCETNVPGIEWVADFCTCEPGYASPTGCRATALGREVDFGTEGCVRATEHESEANFVRLGSISPGQHAKVCPDGSERPQCADRRLRFDFDAGTGKVRGALPLLPAPSQLQRARLHQLGEALAARTDFWEAAADRELKRFLGWYKEGFRKPDSDLPAVRRVVAEHLRRTGSLPSTQALIVTSLLYDAPAEPPKGTARAPQRSEGQGMVESDETPAWVLGPTKLLAAESWLDSLAIATIGESVGYCDYRFVAGGVTGPNREAADRRLIATARSPLEGNAFTDESYFAAAQQLGGCSAGVTRPTESSVGLTYAERHLARTLCAVGARVLPGDFNGEDRSERGLAPAAAHLVARLLSRDARPSEAAALAGDMVKCMNASRAGGPAAACPTPESAVRWLCARIAESAQFSYY